MHLTWFNTMKIFQFNINNDVIMGAIASQITSLTQSFIQTQIKENTKAPRHWPLCGEFTGHQWIPHTKGQLRGKCFHLMTSSWGNPFQIFIQWLITTQCTAGIILSGRQFAMCITLQCTRQCYLYTFVLDIAPAHDIFVLKNTYRQASNTRNT